ncbi:MAG: glycoside hydrolase family 9 protein [Deltaproteobacteria bacterium]
MILNLKPAFGTEVIRINQLGYIPTSPKVAVFLSSADIEVTGFQLVNCITGRVVFENNVQKTNAKVWGMSTAYRLDFSDYKNEGGFYLKLGKTSSECFRIGWDIYEGAADFILQYMRQQRCGFNPFFKDSCHVYDGIIVDHPEKTGEYINVKGGWHDASDYLQYVTTSANATYQMMFAYDHYPWIYDDKHQNNGMSGKNGIPDIIDEIKWGLDWLIKMNPGKNEMYNQIADDRDHRGFRIPTLDTVSYGLGKARPVYFVTGKPQGLGKYKNRSTGVASTAAKYASTFAFAANIFAKIDPMYSLILYDKAQEAWEFALSDPGVNQTACTVSPYFYEEDNYADDMELAAISLYNYTGKTDFLKQAKYWGELEPVTPWMEIHRARHYQYYPFVNLGHGLLAESGDSLIAKQFLSFYRQGLEAIKRFADDDPFNIGIPFQWCSNNLVVAAATQANYYRRLSGDNSFIKMEYALYDWLLGCNPWGTSMICGFPAGMDHPEYPHSAITLHSGVTTFGGLVDGPVYRYIFENLRGIKLYEGDEYADFQNGKAVYHDDIGDYSSNEPTMDGTASLSYILSSLENSGLKKIENYSLKDQFGAIIKTDTCAKKIHLIFSAHEFGEGAEKILNTLKRSCSKASFFLTGDFYKNPKNKLTIGRMINEGHYVGAHSDKHLLYNDWEKRDSLLISRYTFENDLRENYKAMEVFGIVQEKANYFLPPYEWYNASIVNWCRQMGLNVINFSPGIRTNADYTTPDMKNYISSKKIIKDLKHKIKTNENSLNGSIILIHLGTHPDRKDKLYDNLHIIINSLKKRGFSIEKLPESMN